MHQHLPNPVNPRTVILALRQYPQPGADDRHSRVGEKPHSRHYDPVIADLIRNPEVLCRAAVILALRQYPQAGTLSMPIHTHPC